MIDIDSFVGDVHGYQKQGASYGYTKQLGYHPLVATRGGTAKTAVLKSSVTPKVPAGCLSVGSVGSPYGIGELEVTVAQWVAFLNTVDPRGTNPHDPYDSSESGSSWPR